MKFAVLVSGHGTNLQALLDAVKAGTIKAQCAVVIADRRKALALERAKKAGIKTLCLIRKDYATPQSFERDLVIALKEEQVDFIVMAGFMRVMSPFFIKQYPNKIINVHPSLLPAFKGANGIKDTFTYGAKVAGVTVHFVDEKMDHGPIIDQQAFKISPRDTLKTLEARIHEVEHKIFPHAISMYVDGRLKVIGRKVKITEKRRK